MSRLPSFVLIGLGGVLGLLVLLAAALYLLVDTDVYKTRLEARASQALGLELSIAGRPAIDVFPGLRLTLEDVHLRRQGEEIASAQQATVGIALLSLLGDDLRIGKIVLTQPVITRRARARRPLRLRADHAAGRGAGAPAQAWPDVSLSAGHGRLRRQALRQGLRGARLPAASCTACGAPAGRARISCATSRSSPNSAARSSARTASRCST